MFKYTGEPRILDKDSDLFNYLPKINLIKNYLEINYDNLQNDNMIALYGN